MCFVHGNKSNPKMFNCGYETFVIEPFWSAISNVGVISRDIGNFIGAPTGALVHPFGEGHKFPGQTPGFVRNL